MKKIIKLSLVIGLLVSLFTFSSCYYDNLERLNPKPICDTSGVITYTGNIKSIMDNNCTICHSGTTPLGGVSLDTYAGVKSQAVTGRLYNSVTWINTPSTMPKGSPTKIDDCSINKIKKWIDTNYNQ